MNIPNGFENSGRGIFATVVLLGMVFGAMIVLLVNRPVEKKPSTVPAKRPSPGRKK
jgi:hypothetical protein